MKIRITKSDVVNSSVYLAGYEIDLPGAEAKDCIDAGIAVVVPVSTETADVHEIKIEPVQKLKKEKGA